MQLIEVSEIGVRAAIVRLTSSEHRLAWLMFPMVHLGERGYYDQIDEKMRECEMVLVEGVDSAVVAALTSAYRLAADPGRRSTVQPRNLPSSDHMTIRHADMTGAEFDAAWAKLPVGLRLGIPILAPLYGLWLRYVANPKDWQSRLQTDDLPTTDEVLLEGELPAFFQLLLRERHEHLFHQIDDVQREWGDLEKMVGVAWGAKHIGAVTSYLIDRHGYMARSAEWVTVFDYTK